MKLSAGAIVALIVAAIVLCGFGYMGYQNHVLSKAVATAQTERDAANKALDTAAEANRAQAATIADLLETGRRDSDTLVGIASDLKKINATQAQMAKDRKALAEKNPDVKAYLNTPVPPALRRVRPAAESR